MIRFGGKILWIGMLVVCGCSKGEDAQQAKGASSAAPAAGKLVHVTFTKNECTFDFDTPEALKEKTSDAVSVTYEGASFGLQGFSGAALYKLEGLVGQLALWHKKTPTYQGTEGGVNLVIAPRDTPMSPLHAIGGHGEEAADRSMGCSFLCNGTKEREADVIAMCKSVRIKYDASKAPK
ncbi:hypothetical protein [Polyangium fumosum]|uniref:Uncharacterized protein n=1 Tax=Polyangium fumosum TaxID=889272 RepID=A0A4U1ISP0_9BACT|nr:hypothetical protein [Polyangium fumosum]TKC97248.1 hypothetical protein E8A74_43830 [Polyangium fumosum]